MRKKIDYKHLIEDVCNFTCENDNYSKPLPSLKAQEALNELCDYFLGEDWYESTGQVHPEIVNFAIVEEIEKRYRGAKIKRNRRTPNDKESRGREVGDLMLTICECRYKKCPIEIVGMKKPACVPATASTEKCRGCVMEWMNEECET